MQRLQPEQQITDSMTAIYVMDALDRYLHMYKEYRDLFSTKDVELTEFMMNCLANKKNDFNRFHSLYYPLQHTIVNQTGGTGFDEHMVSRKLYVRNTIENKIIEKIKRVIFLGGGYDIRPYSLAMDNTDLQVIELDLGQTRENKIDFLQRYSRLKNLSLQREQDGTVIFHDNLYCLKCDLTKDSIEKILKAKNLDSEEKTLYVVEGLTSYLDKVVIQKMLQELQHLLKEGDEILISFVPSCEHTRIGKQSMKKTNENYVFALPPEEVPAFVHEFGFDVKSKALHESLLRDISENKLATLIEHDAAVPKCHFYVLTKTVQPSQHIKNIQDVKDDHLIVPALQVSKKSCTIV